MERTKTKREDDCSCGGRLRSMSFKALPNTPALSKTGSIQSAIVRASDFDSEGFMVELACLFSDL